MYETNKLLINWCRISAINSMKTKHSLKLTIQQLAPENRSGPKREIHLPTIHFQGWAVSFGEYNIQIIHIYIFTYHRKTRKGKKRFYNKNQALRMTTWEFKNPPQETGFSVCHAICGERCAICSGGGCDGKTRTLVMICVLDCTVAFLVFVSIAWNQNGCAQFLHRIAVWWCFGRRRR